MLGRVAQKYEDHWQKIKPKSKMPKLKFDGQNQKMEMNNIEVMVNIIIDSWGYPIIEGRNFARNSKRYEKALRFLPRHDRLQEPVAMAEIQNWLSRITNRQKYNECLLNMRNF
jgi:hypothetical protein